MENEELLDSFLKACQKDVLAYATGRLKLILPSPTQTTVLRICAEAKDLFSRESMVIRINKSLVVVGDIHGHILDLYRILQKFGMPPNHNYLFLGDIVDRGEFSIESLLIVFLMKILYPENVYLIRGNHEFDYLASSCGFARQVNNSQEYEAFIDAFTMMPIAALIQDTKLAIHGGIGPSLFGIRQIEQIKRPLFDFGEDLTDSILWSDPAEVEGFEPSPRGTGYIFGGEPLYDFLADNQLDLLIRAHECVEQGTQYKFCQRLITVFSASNYCGISENSAGVLLIDAKGQCTTENYDPLPYLRRQMASFDVPPNQVTPRVRKCPQKISHATTHKSLKLTRSYNILDTSSSPNLLPPLLDRKPISLHEGAVGSPVHHTGSPTHHTNKTTFLLL